MLVNMKKLQEKAERLLDEMQVPSVSITCWQDGVSETVTAGCKDLENQIPADEDTLYSIGSCTKSFTAAAIAVLCDRGLLSLEDPVRKYVPEFGMYDPYVSEHLTIRDMLCHRCGLPRHELAWYSRLSEYSEEQMLDMLRFLKPNVPFRYKMQYQNVMFTLAGIVISRVSGTTWKDFVQKNLIEPLGMGAVSYDAAELETFEGRATGYRYFDGEQPGNRQVPYCPLYTMCPAGSMSMTSAQLAMWDAMFLNGGKAADGTQVISGEMCKEMTSPQMLISDPIIKPLQGYQDMCSYGLGFFIESYRGTKILHHGGHIDGFLADQCFVPEKNFACVVLTNSENSYITRALRYSILDEALGLEPVDWASRFRAYKAETESQQQAEATDRKEALALSAAYPCPVSLSEIAGTYRDNGYGTIVVAEEEGGLSVQLGTLTLHGFHYRSQYFIFTEEHVLPGVELEAEAEYDKDGKVTAFLMRLEFTSEEKIRFVRK
ncbi:MAG: serine hydrolase [Candidatus Limivivens sp.]|nr:serine hydrolase [Candidatus Limivivens sp.]